MFPREDSAGKRDITTPQHRLVWRKNERGNTFIPLDSEGQNTTGLASCSIFITYLTMACEFQGKLIDAASLEWPFEAS